MKTSAALILSALSMASAFAPATNMASKTSLDACVSKETVLSEPDTTEFGGIWDPLGLADIGSDETIAWYRHSEIKHGRVAVSDDTCDSSHFPVFSVCMCNSYLMFFVLLQNTNLTP